MNTTKHKEAFAPSTWLAWVPRVGVFTAAFTALCCIGVAAALSLASAVGATFLTRDATLRPALAATLALTVVGSAFTYRRHRNPWPLALTIASSALVYLTIFGPVERSHATHDEMHGAGTHETGASSRSGGPFVWFGLALLIGAQGWDIVRVRRCSLAHERNRHTEDRSVGLDLEALGSPGRAVRSALSRMPEEVTAVREAVFDAVRRGEALAPTQIASSSGLSVEQIHEATELMSSVGVVDVDERGLLQGTGGLTLRTTPHELVLSGTPLHTWCAIDAIGIPVGLNEDAHVTTHCPHCGTRLALEIRGGHAIGNGSAVAWFPTATCSNMSQGLCPQANLFCHTEHLEAWREAVGRPEGIVLQMSEIEEVGRRVWRDSADPALFRLEKD